VIRLTKRNLVVRDSDCLALVTAHEDYNSIDLDEIKNLMRTPVIVDGRKVFDKEECIRRGFTYRGIGR
jgi:UDPglucose 6-dehydrogenase